MKESDSSNSLYGKRNKIQSIVDGQKLLKKSEHDNWSIKIYWGQLPSLSEVTQLGFSGYAITEDVTAASIPDLDGSDCTQVTVGPRSVIIWSASSEAGLESKIKSTFNNMKWEKEKHEY